MTNAETKTVEPWEPGRDAVEQVRDAVQLAGEITPLGVHPTAIAEFYSAIACFLGGSLDNADAFLTKVPEDRAPEHRVYWLQGKSLGSLALKAHVGVEGANVPADVSGYVRSLDDVARVEILGINAGWPFSVGFPTIEPDVSIQFVDGDVLEIRTTQRPTDAAQKQAAEFVRKLLEALSRRA